MNQAEIQETLKQPGASILISRIDHIGDTLLFTPALADLRKAYPKSRITVLANNLTRPVLEGNPDVSEIVAYEDSYFNSWRDIENFYKYMRGRNFDLVLNFSAAVKDYLEAYRLGGNFRIGPVYDRMLVSRLVSCFLLNKRIICPEDPGSYEESDDKTKLSHEVEQNRKLTGYLGAPATDAGLKLPLEGDDVEFAEMLLYETLAVSKETDVIGVQLSDRWFWPDNRSEGIAWLIKSLSEAFTGKFILCFTYPGIEKMATKACELYFRRMLTQKEALSVSKTALVSDTENSRLTTLEKVEGKNVCILSNLPLKKYAALLSLCRTMITCHSGATHISAAVDTPPVVIFNKPYFNYFSNRESPWGVKYRAFPKQLSDDEFSGTPFQGREEAVAEHITAVLENTRGFLEEIGGN